MVSKEFVVDDCEKYFKMVKDCFFALHPDGKVSSYQFDTEYNDYSKRSARDMAVRFLDGRNMFHSQYCDLGFIKLSENTVYDLNMFLKVDKDHGGTRLVAKDRKKLTRFISEQYNKVKNDMIEDRHRDLWLDRNPAKAACQELFTVHWQPMI
jgi:hypothetical protein